MISNALVYFAAEGATLQRRQGGRETVGNSLERAPLGGSGTSATTGWTDGKPWEIAWGEPHWEGATLQR